MNSPAPTADTVALSAHATWQYRQRVKPGLDLQAARDELGGHGPSARSPPWRRTRSRRQASVGPPAARRRDRAPARATSRRLDRDHLRHPANAHTNQAHRQIRAQGLARRPQTRPTPSPPLNDTMPIAAHTTGGHATPHLLLGLAVLLLAIAGAGTCSPPPPDSRPGPSAPSAPDTAAREPATRPYPHRRSQPARHARPDRGTPRARPHRTPISTRSGRARRRVRPRRAEPRHVRARQPCSASFARDARAAGRLSTQRPAAHDRRGARSRDARGVPVRGVVCRAVCADGRPSNPIRDPRRNRRVRRLGAHRAASLGRAPVPQRNGRSRQSEAARISRAGAGRPVPRTRRNCADRAALVGPPPRTRRLGDGTRMADPLDPALRPPARVRGPRHSTATGAHRPATRRPTPARTRRRARHRLTKPIPRDAGPLRRSPVPVLDHL